MEVLELLDRKIDIFQKMHLAGIKEASEVLSTLQQVRKSLISLNQTS